MRYTRRTIFEKVQPYLGEDDVTYRELPLEDGLPVFYESETEGAIDDRELSHVTVYRWIESLSRYTPVIRRGLQLIRGRSPASPLIFRKLQAILPCKFRIGQRRLILQRCQKLFRVEAVYRSLFHTSMFPQLAAQQAWACASGNEVAGGDPG